LAATAVGLGSALTTLPLLFGADLSQLLGLPDEIRPMAVVPLGWPERPLGLSRRTPVAQKAHRDSYGTGW
ncbi:MAG: nitroreductase family protein, partial [Acidimicrobiales bacterium]